MCLFLLPYNIGLDLFSYSSTPLYDFYFSIPIFII